MSLRRIPLRDILTKENARWVRYYAAEKVHRNISRLRKPARILKGFDEYSMRRSIARSIADSSDQALLALKKEGRAGIVLSPPLVNELLDSAQKRLATVELTPFSSGKPFFSQLLTAADYEANLDSVFLRVALDEGILATVARYIGVAPYLHSIDLLHSRPTNGGLSQSQLWHQDRDDRSLLRLLVYLTPVSAESGPFCFFPVSESRKVPGYVPHYVSDETIERYLPLSRAVKVMGDVGTTILVDTGRCYHMGSRCTEPRLTYWAYYTTGFGYNDRSHRWPLEADQRRGLSTLQRLALGAPLHG